MKRTCERCGRQRETIVVENTANTQQQSHICQECAKTVIKPNTVWQVKRKERH